MRKPADVMIVLTPFEHSDAPSMAEGDRDPEHRKWFEFPSSFVPSVTHSEEVVARWEIERAAGSRLPFAVRNAFTHELLGGCELKPQSSAVANVSYWTYPPHRRTGVAKQAVRLLCEFAFADMGLRRLELLIEPSNTASLHVAAAAGFAAAGARGTKLLFVLDRNEGVSPS